MLSIFILQSNKSKKKYPLKEVLFISLIEIVLFLLYISIIYWNYNRDIKDEHGKLGEDVFLGAVVLVCIIIFTFLLGFVFQSPTLPNDNNSDDINESNIKESIDLDKLHKNQMNKENDLEEEEPHEVAINKIEDNLQKQTGLQADNMKKRPESKSSTSEEIIYSDSDGKTPFGESELYITPKHDPSEPCELNLQNENTNNIENPSVFLEKYVPSSEPTGGYNPNNYSELGNEKEDPEYYKNTCSKEECEKPHIVSNKEPQKS